MFLVEFTQCICLSGRRQKKTSPLPHIKKKKIEAITFVFQHFATEKSSNWCILLIEWGPNTLGRKRKNKKQHAIMWSDTAYLGCFAALEYLIFFFWGFISLLRVFFLHAVFITLACASSLFPLPFVCLSCCFTSTLRLKALRAEKLPSCKSGKQLAFDNIITVVIVIIWGYHFKNTKGQCLKRQGLRAAYILKENSILVLSISAFIRMKKISPWMCLKMVWMWCSWTWFSSGLLELG